MELGINNPADQWADGILDLSNRCKKQLIGEDKEVLDKWIGVCDKIRKQTHIMTPEILAIAMCRIAGWKAYLKDIEPDEDQVD